MPREPSWFRNITTQSHGVLELRRDGEHADEVGRLEWGGQSRTLQRNIEDGAIGMRIQPFQRGPEQRGRGSETSGKLESLVHGSGAFQLVNGGNMDLAGYTYLWSNGRDVNHVAGKQRSVLGHVAEYQQVVQVKVADGFPVPAQLNVTQRALDGGAAGGKQRCHQGAERAKGVSAGATGLAHDKHLDRPQLPHLHFEIEAFVDM